MRSAVGALLRRLPNGHRGTGIGGVATAPLFQGVLPRRQQKTTKVAVRRTGGAAAVPPPPPPRLFFTTSSTWWEAVSTSSNERHEAAGIDGVEGINTERGEGVRLSRLLSSRLLLASSSDRECSAGGAASTLFTTCNSRREAERLIRAGTVSINGQVVTHPHFLVGPKDFVGSTHDDGSTTRRELTIQVRGDSLTLAEQDFFKAVASADRDATAASTTTSSSTSTTAVRATTTIPPSVPRVWIAHKFSGELVTEHDPHDRPSLLERLRRGGVGKQRQRRGGAEKYQHSRLVAVGRLDMSTEGLILLTDDGRYAREMELPHNQVHRTYRVRVHGLTDLDRVRTALERGVTVDGIRYHPMRLRPDPTTRFANTNRWIEVTCCQGKNRQIRKVLQHFGLTVTRLIRVSYGDYQLETIPPGMAIEVPHKPLESQRRRGDWRHRRGSSATQSTTNRSTIPDRRGS